jgi:hypothetical protein
MNFSSPADALASFRIFATRSFRLIPANRSTIAAARCFSAISSDLTKLS